MPTSGVPDQNNLFPVPDDFENKLKGLKSSHGSPDPNNSNQDDSDFEQGQNGYGNQHQANDQGTGHQYEAPSPTYFTNPMTNNQYTNNNGYQQAGYGYQNPQPSNSSYFDTGVTEPEVQKTANKDTSAQKGQKNEFINSLSTIFTKKWWVVGVIVIVVSLVSIGAFYYINRPPQFDSSAFTNVSARIEAPSTSPSGSPERYRVVVQNRESVTIQNIEVRLEFDRAFQYTRPINPDPVDPSGSVYRFQSLAGLGQGTSEIIIQFEGALTGNIDEETLMSGTITYTPVPLINNENSTRTVQVQSARTRITAPEISINLASRDQSVQNGGEIELIATFENQSERDLRDVRIVVDYPTGNNFTYVSSELRITNSDPKTRPDSGNNIWDLPVLPRLQTQTLNIKGNLFGADGIRQPFRLNIEIRDSEGNYRPLATDALDITVTAQPLVISTRIEGKDTSRLFSPGDTLTFVIDYQNRSTTTIQNVEIFGIIDDPANILDYNSISFIGGDAGNINNRTIQWRGNNSPQLVTLTPQVRGQIRYTIRVKDGDSFIQSNLNQTSYTLRPRAQGKASNVQQFEVSGELYRATGELTFTQRVESITDDPVQRNKKTYLIVLEFRTKQNQVNDVRFETITELPPTAWRQASIEPSDNASEISYDSATGKITWNPGRIPGYTGLSVPVKSISFELTVETAPGSSPIPTLLNAGTIQGVDDFTGESYEFSSSELRGNPIQP